LPIPTDFSKAFLPSSSRLVFAPNKLTAAACQNKLGYFFNPLCLIGGLKSNFQPEKSIDIQSSETFNKLITRRWAHIFPRKMKSKMKASVIFAASFRNERTQTYITPTPTPVRFDSVPIFGYDHL